MDYIHKNEFKTKMNSIHCISESCNTRGNFEFVNQLRNDKNEGDFMIGLDF